MKKIKPEIMWAVYNSDHGFYTDTGLTQKEMKEKHLNSLGHTDWKPCEVNGDICVKVKLTPVS
jgi:hypothetical protein